MQTAGREGWADRRPSTFWALRIIAVKTEEGASGSGASRVAKRMNRTLRRLTEALRRRRHDDVVATGRWLGRVVKGWLNYYAVPNSFWYLLPPFHAAVDPHMVEKPASALPEGSLLMATTRCIVRHAVAPCADRSSLAGPTICRQPPEVGAGCLNGHVRIWCARRTGRR